MSTKNTGGPAFPESYVGADRPHEGIGDGMTLRDHFAGKALEGFMAGFQTRGFSISPDMQDQIAGGMYSMADAMLKARAA